MRTVLRALIRFYQLAISPMLGPRCRYYPSCSNYALQAIQLHGPLRGTALAGWRLLRCNPWSPGGVDFPPPRRDGKGSVAPPEAEPPAEPGHVYDHAHDHAHSPVSDHAVTRGESQAVPAAYDTESSDPGRVPDGSTDRRSTPQGV